MDWVTLALVGDVRCVSVVVHPFYVLVFCRRDAHVVFFTAATSLSPGW